MRTRTRRSYAIEAAGYAAIWTLNVVAMTRHFRSMDMIEGLTAGMIFVFAPVAVWQAVRKLGERRDD